jgi:RimJ/RimL family protein N-acetyltransferase
MIQPMGRVDPVTLEFNGVRLEPLALHHADGLRAAASDGELWNLRITSVPAPHDTVIGSTSYHDIVPAIDRVEIGYTWYAKSHQRSHVNTSCKLLLLSHAFDTLGCFVVGLRTDNFNYASQAAIERLGAKKDGVLRHHAPRRDGTVRDTVMYSILRGEWPEIKSQLHYRLSRHAA